MRILCPSSLSYVVSLVKRNFESVASLINVKSLLFSEKEYLSRIGVSPMPLTTIISKALLFGFNLKMALE